MNHPPLGKGAHHFDAEIEVEALKKAFTGNLPISFGPLLKVGAPDDQRVWEPLIRLTKIQEMPNGAIRFCGVTSAPKETGVTSDEEVVVYGHYFPQNWEGSAYVRKPSSAR